MPGTDFVLRNQDYARQLAARQQQPATAASSETPFGFGDVLDIVNPLQHIPVISTLYRHLTGDKIGTPEQIAGDTLYGGLTGFVSSVGSAIFTGITGKSIGDTVYAALIGDDDEPATGVASATDTAPATTFAGVSPMQASSAYRASGRLMEAF